MVNVVDDFFYGIHVSVWLRVNHVIDLYCVAKN